MFFQTCNEQIYNLADKFVLLSDTHVKNILLANQNPIKFIYK